MKRPLALLLPLLSVAQATDYGVGCKPNKTATCTGDWKKHDGECYLFIKDQNKAWEAAEKHCQGEGGNLASVTEGNIKFLTGELGNLQFWTGAILQENKDAWVWADCLAGIPSDIIWGEGQPGNRAAPRCGALSKFEKLESASCTTGYKVVCSRSLIGPTPSTSTGSTSIALVVGLVAVALGIVIAGIIFREKVKAALPCI